MALNITNITPTTNSNFIGLDSKITIEFDKEPDIFTLTNGISLYILTEADWTGPDLGTLDSKYSDVLTVGDEYTFYNLQYSINGNIVTATPSTGLIPNMKHYIQVLPGNDATRFVSARTTSDPEYQELGRGGGEINITSAYTGSSNAIFTIVFIDETAFSVTKDELPLGNFTFEQGVPVDIGELSFSVNGTFSFAENVVINAFAAQGLSVVAKTTFTTTNYETVAPTTSVRIEDKLANFQDELKVINSIPAGMTINNQKCNPIIFKFNYPLDPNQDFSNKIAITKINIDNGMAKNVSFAAKVNGNILKIYLVAVKEVLSGNELPLYGLTDVVEINESISFAGDTSTNINILK